MKILITGVPGTGKSTISKVLNEKGIKSVDFSDIPGLCCWRDKTTKQKVEYSPIDNIEWFNKHERICDLEKLKEFLYKHNNLVVTGIASGNQTEYLHFFNKVILLQSKPETLISRMQNREKLFGKTKAEQDHVKEWQKNLDPQILSYGGVPINTEGSLDSTIDKVINQIKRNAKNQYSKTKGYGVSEKGLGSSYKNP